MKKLRDESELIFDLIFQPWSGDITEKAKESLKR